MDALKRSWLQAGREFVLLIFDLRWNILPSSGGEFSGRGPASLSSAMSVVSRSYVNGFLEKKLICARRYWSQSSKGPCVGLGARAIRGWPTMGTLRQGLRIISPGKRVMATQPEPVRYICSADLAVDGKRHSRLVEVSIQKSWREKAFRSLRRCDVWCSSLRGISTAWSAATDKEGVEQEREAETKPELRIFNTMSRKKEIFRPKVADKVSLYVCGVTAYDYSHIGHARVYVAFDVLFRYLKSLGYDVTYVRNFTDVDDKIINRANETGEDPVKLSDRFCEEFNIDMAALRCLPPNVEPRVTGHISQIIQMVDQIISNGHAYVMEGGDVYFSVDSFPSYGQLSRRTQDENRAGERVAIDSRKRTAADFALWKSAKPGEISWESPWGRGRPGWHIECSAMSAAHLGPSFDIHGGGADLVFPHHENEIAQSCAACAESNVGYWLHNGFVTIDSEKMSKSVGNFFTIREVLQRYSPLALRWFLIGTQYRAPVNYSKHQLESASDRVYYLYQALADSEEALVGDYTKTQPASKEVMECVKGLKSTCATAMADDLLTPVVIASLSEPLKMMNDLLHTKKGRKDRSRLASLKDLKAGVESVLDVLGLTVSSYVEVLHDIKRLALKRAGLTEEDLISRVQERAAARAAKEYERSDNIRKDLASLGIALMDGGDGTQWRPAIADDQP